MANPTQGRNIQTDSTKDRVYLDHNATTPLHPEVRARLLEWADDWGNPSSIHQEGRGPKARMREARDSIAKILGAHPLELIFTAGGSESNNLVLKSIQTFANESKRHILLSSLEHPSLKRAAEAMARAGFDVELIRAHRSGVIDLDDLEAKLRPGQTALVSVMLANNETGVIQPLEDVVRLAKVAGARVHTDAVQALGKIPVNVRELGVDYASFAGHKFYALKGAGVLYVAKGAPLEPLIYGGGQERHRRGGTENVLAIASLGYMASKAGEIGTRAAEMARLRDRFEMEVLTCIGDVSINGAGEKRLPSTSSLLIPGTDGETMLMALDMEGFAVSTGAACSSGSPEPSPVLLAMGLTRAEAQCSLRVGVGWGTTDSDIDRFILVLKKVVDRLRGLKGYQVGQVKQSEESSCLT